MNPPSQSLMFFEQSIVDAEQAENTAALARRSAAKAAAKAAREEKKSQEEMAKSSRRLARQAAYRRKHPPGHAQCGIRWYPAGSGWTHCHDCGQALIYTTDPNAKPQVCKGRI